MPQGAQPADAWILVYEDASVEDERFSGDGATEAARKRFDRARENWACHLFRCVRSA